MSHVPRILVDLPLAVDGAYTLPAAKAHHLHNVLRLGPGAPLRLFNGDGFEYHATINRSARGTVDVAIERADTPAVESPLELTLAQGIARSDRMDFAIAKAVELGVGTIRPLVTERGKVRLAGRRMQKKQAHWQSVAESAAEQSGRLVWPRVTPAIAFNELLAEDSDALRLILAPQSATGLRQLQPAWAITLLVGPESGFSGAEIEAAGAAGCTPLRLGPRILRTETAGMAALAALQGHRGDLG